MKPTELDLDTIPRPTRKKAPPQTAIRKTADWRLICRSLRQDGPQTAAALVKNLGIHEDMVHFILKFYIKHGVIERVGRRVKLTDQHVNFGKPQPRKAGTPKPKRHSAWSHVLTSED